MIPDRDQDFDLQQVIAVLWKRWWVIALLALTGGIVAFAVSSRAPDLYQATSVVRLTNPNANRLFNGPQQNVDPKRLVDTETKVLLANDTRIEVEQRLAERRALLSGVAVTNPAGTDLLEVTVTSPSPALASDAANAWTDVYVANRRDENVNDLSQRATDLREQADELDRQMAELRPDDPRRGQLQASQNSFLALANQYDAEAGLLKTDVKVVDRAQIPDRPVSPQPTRDAAVATVLALIFAVGLVFLLDRLDDGIAGPDDLDVLLPAVPLLGSVPVHDAHRRWGRTKLPHGARRVVPGDSAAAEVYRTVRSNLRFSSLGQTRRILMVTSPSGSEGKSTVTSNLAVSLADNGQRVVVVSADLRRPALSQFFGIEEQRRGLTTVLLGDDPATDCLVPVLTRTGHLLHILPSGPLPPNPAELLGSQAMGDALQTLADRDVDFVLIDSPPVLPVADSLAIAQFADGVILVSVVAETRAANLVEAHERLVRVGADIIGIVLNGVSTGSRYPYYYSARYTRDEPTEQADTTAIDVNASNGKRTAGNNGAKPAGPSLPTAPASRG